MPSKSDISATPGVSDDAIRDRAYFLWEADGRPDGRGDHYWGLALAELTAAASAPAAPKAKKSSAPPKSAAKSAGKTATGKAAKKAEAIKPAKTAKKAEAAKPAKKAATKPRAAAVTTKKPK